jgi:nicotinate-nucleotide adenylyltransferase
MAAADFYACLCPTLDARVERELSSSRAAHSRGVALLAAELCGRQGLDPEKGRAAGLAHDLCKELDLEMQRRLALRFGEARPGVGEWRTPDGDPLSDEILHGPAAAWLLFDEYGVEDADLLDAVALHTVGSPDMGLLAIILYCADKIEPGRKHVDAAFRQRCLKMEPKAMLLAVVDDCIGWLEKKGRVVAPSTRILYNALRNPVNKP